MIEVNVKPQPDLDGGTPEVRAAGYVEHRVVLHNHSKTADHVVRLYHPVDGVGYYEDFLERNSRTVQVAHGATLTVSLFQPPLSVADESLVVEIDGVRQKDFVDFSCPFDRGFGYYSGASQPMVVLASRGIPQEFKDEVRLRPCQRNRLLS